MATKKATKRTTSKAKTGVKAKRSTMSAPSPAYTAVVTWLVWTFTILSIIFAVMAFVRYGQ